MRNPEFLIQIADMGFDGGSLYRQLAGDLLIAVARIDKPRDLRMVKQSLIKVGMPIVLNSLGAMLFQLRQTIKLNPLPELLGLQPEDWLDMSTPVNAPGTGDQYPNWRRKLSLSLEAMFADDGINRLIKDPDKRRKAATSTFHRPRPCLYKVGSTRFPTPTPNVLRPSP